MKEAEFRAWFKTNDYDDATIGTQLARGKRIEQHYGDLDELFRNGTLASLKAELSYSADDERAGRPNPAKFEVNGSIRNSMASYCSTIEYYTKFCLASQDADLPHRQEQLAQVKSLATGDVIATMDDCDTVGIEQFLRSQGFVRPSRWVLRPGSEKRYPAKAIIAVALGRLPQGKPLSAKEFFGGFGEAQAFARLEELGFELVGKDEMAPETHALTRKAVEAAMDECDRLGETIFIEQRGFGPSRDYRVLRDNGKTYPSKPIAGVALGYLPGGTARTAKNFNGGYSGKKSACSLLEAAGYQIVPASEGAFAEQVVVPEARASTRFSHLRGTPMNSPTNLILYGPPGTGKTYRTALEAVALCDGAADYAETPEGRAALMARYNELVEQERISFVTFHQNYGYEDFVEALRPTNYGEDGEPLESGFRLAPEAGIFTKMSERAEALRSAGDGGYDFTGKRFFKMSLGEVANPEDDYLFDEAIEGGFVHLGDDGGMDWSEPRFTTKAAMIDGYAERHPDLPRQHPNNGIIEFPYRMRVRARIGDIIIVSKGNLLFRAIGEVVGDYHQVERENDDYTMRLAVKWLWIDREGVSHDVIYGKRFSQRTIYEFSNSELKLDAIRGLIEAERSSAKEGPSKSFVLIIDEINRANISKVFGELITLLEPDKRAGMTNELSVTLPYSKRQFSVPANLHIIGTMNTADRSIALLDTALRRRFNFRELAPDADLLKDASKETGIDLVRALTIINQRIEYLIDREHRIGHAFFINCKALEDVHAAMRDKVIPLLQEYFFEDWSRIHLVLGDGFIGETKLDPPPGFEGEPISSWSVLTSFKSDAFDRLIASRRNGALSMQPAPQSEEYYDAEPS